MILAIANFTWPAIIVFALHRIHIDIVTAWIWMLALVFVLVAIARILFEAIYLLVGKLRKRKTQYKKSVYYISKSVLYILSYCVAYSLVQLSIASANSKAIEEAMYMKEAVQTTGACLPYIDGWVKSEETDGYDLYSSYGEFGTKYRIRYSCSNGSSLFSFSVKINYDTGFNIQHSSDGTLRATFGHWNNLQEIVIEKTTDLSRLAKMERMQTD